MLMTERFLFEIERFITRNGMSPTAFGKRAVGDPNLVADLRAGRSPGLGLVEKVHAFMQASSRVSAGSSPSPSNPKVPR